jgi:CheY-like chemotaxis protein
MAYPTQNKSPKRTCKILVIDDNQDAADTLSMILKLKGNQVEPRYNGSEGIATADSFLPDVVLLDIGMPGLDGYQTCQLIRDADWGKSMSIFALTGYGQPNDFRKSTVAGFDAHLLKPVDLPQLLSLIEGLS